MASVRRLSNRDGEWQQGSMAFTLTKPVDLGRLDVELQQAMGWDQVAGMMAEGDPATASDEHPAVIWVLPLPPTAPSEPTIVSLDAPPEVRGEDEEEPRQAKDFLDARSFSKVVTAHVKPESDMDRFRALVAKSRSEERFTSDELQEAVRMLLRFASTTGA